MPKLDPEITTLPLDTAINADGYMPGLANPVTSAEVKDIYMDNRVPVADREAALSRLRQEMVARDAADTLPDTRSLIDEIDAGLAFLREDGDGSVDPAALALRDTAVNPANF